MEVMMVEGKVENIFDEEDFARMLGEKLGYDAERYFRDQMASSQEMLDLLREVKDSLDKLSKRIKKTTKDDIQDAIEELSYEINKEL